MGEHEAFEVVQEKNRACSGPTKTMKIAMMGDRIEAYPSVFVITIGLVLIYDFFGVVTLLGTSVVLIIAVLSFYSLVREYSSKLARHSWYKVLTRIIASVLIIGFLTVGALFLSSFIVGMFKDVVLGSKILGYGMAAIVAGLLLFIVALAFFL